MKNGRKGFGSISLDLSSQLLKSLLMSFPPIRRWRLKRPRTSLDINNTEAYLRNNAFLGLNLLLEYTGDIKSKSICEIGAGDFLTSGLSMLAAGAWSYTVIDKFPGDYSGRSAKTMYAKVAENWERFFPHMVWDRSIKPTDFPDEYGNRVKLVGDPVEKARIDEEFDIVCSFQVGEHISDLNSFAEMHNRLLKSAGGG